MTQFFHRLRINIVSVNIVPRLHNVNRLKNRRRPRGWSESSTNRESRPDGVELNHSPKIPTRISNWDLSFSGHKLRIEVVNGGHTGTSSMVRRDQDKRVEFLSPIIIRMEHPNNTLNLFCYTRFVTRVTDYSDSQVSHPIIIYAGCYGSWDSECIIPELLTKNRQ